MHKIVLISSRKPEKILGFSSKFKKGPVTLNTGIFLFGLSLIEIRWPFLKLCNLSLQTPWPIFKCVGSVSGLYNISL